MNEMNQASFKSEDRVLADDTWVRPDADESIGETFSRLIGSGKEYAHAEMDRQRLRAGIVGAGARDAAILLGGALVIALAAIGALLVGLIFTLTPVLTAGGATAAVVVVALIVAGLLVLGAKSRITRMTKDMKA
jgi:uncharacterized membrane protein YbhN (UPF0104 family)